MVGLHDRSRFPLAPPYDKQKPDRTLSRRTKILHTISLFTTTSSVVLARGPISHL